MTGAVAGGGEQAREGTFCLFAMVHTLRFDAPDGPPDTVPWDGRAPGGPFSSASKPCSAEAPVNNVSSDLPVLGGVLEHGRVPSSTRTHPLRFEVSRAGGAAVLRGTISRVASSGSRWPTHTAPRSRPSQAHNTLITMHFGYRLLAALIWGCGRQKAGTGIE